MTSFNKILSDYMIGVYGIRRKRAKYRCVKRGVDFNKYDEAVRKEQRKSPRANEYLGLIKEQMLDESPLWSAIKKDSGWGCGSLIFPFSFKKRKRSEYRNKK